MNRTINYLKSFPKYVWVLTLIIVVGIFFRVYNFHDWMSFNTDGVRDAIAVSHSVEDGLGELPLLGPRAGGTQLHLGPIFYYFEYLAGAIFQSTNPVIFALPTLLFSILTLPLFFFLLREYFSPKMSLAMTAMFATCFMAIEYSRFAWNPNATPFFTVLFFFALLKAYNSDKKRHIWFAISGGALAIASQLHFSAFLGLPIIFVLFAAINWKKTIKIFSWKSLLAFFGTIFVLYIPVFVFEFLTNGKNTKLFFDAIGSKGSAHRTISERIIEDVDIFSKYFLWIIAGIIDGKKWQEALSTLLLFAGTLANLFLMIKEADEKKKRFISLSLIFILTFFVLYIPLAFDIKRSRFFLPVIIVPFMLIGYLVAFARHIGFRQKWRPAIAILIAVLIFGNVRSTLAWFSNMNMSQTGIKDSSFKKVSEKNKEFWWTWGRFENAAKHMDENCEKENVFFIISRKTKDFGDSMEYAFKEVSGKKVLFREKYNEEYEKYDSCYYYISLAKENLPNFLEQKKYESPFIMGDMKIIRWYPEISGTAVFPTKKIGNRNDSLKNKIKSDYPRILWRDLFK